MHSIGNRKDEHRLNAERLRAQHAAETPEERRARLDARNALASEKRKTTNAASAMLGLSSIDRWARGTRRKKSRRKRTTKKYKWW